MLGYYGLIQILHGDKIKIPVLERYYKLKQRKSGGNHTGIIQLFDFKPDKEYEWSRISHFTNILFLHIEKQDFIYYL